MNKQTVQLALEIALAVIAIVLKHKNQTNKVSK